MILLKVVYLVSLLVFKDLIIIHHRKTLIRKRRAWRILRLKILMGWCWRENRRILMKSRTTNTNILIRILGDDLTLMRRSTQIRKWILLILWLKIRFWILLLNISAIIIWIIRHFLSYLLLLRIIHTIKAIILLILR